LKNDDQRLIILLLIVILKNVNNLLIELGLSGVVEFIKDLKKYLEDNPNRLKAYRKFILKILEEFIVEFNFKER
jgi:hypothetical protein